MKKLLAVLGLAFLGSVLAGAQTTAVTATVVDSDSTTWANGTWVLSFQPGPYAGNPAAYTIGGSPLGQSTAYQSGSMNGSGVMSFTTYRSTAISPIGSTWNLQICPNASTPCATLNFQTNASSQDISTAVNNIIQAPRFQAKSGAYGYADSEAIVQITTGGTYWNVTTSSQRCYTGSAWGACNSSGSGGFPITLGSTAVAANSTTPAVVGLTIDGVSPTTMAFVDATSSIQTQLNGKAPSNAATTVNSQTCTLGLSCTVTAAPSGSAGGDLSGTYPNPAVAGLKSVPFCTGFTPTNGQALEYTTASSPNPCYTAATISGGSGTVTSVALSLPADFNVTGSPVTTSGTLTAAFANTPTGTGGFVRATSPTLVTPALGTPSAAVLTNATGLPLSGHTNQAADTVVMNASGSSAAPTAVAMPTCTSGADLYNTTTHTWSCVTTGGGGGLPTLETHTASASASLNFTTCITGSYHNYRIFFDNLVPASSGDILIRLSANGGSTYDSTSSHYKVASYWSDWALATNGNTTPNSTATGWSMTGNNSQSTTGGTGISGWIEFSDVDQGTGFVPASGNMSYRNNSSVDDIQLMLNLRYVNNAFNAFQVISAGGNLTSGTVTCQPWPQ